jgi:hypothetical protein
MPTVGDSLDLSSRTALTSLKTPGPFFQWWLLYTPGLPWILVAGDIRHRGIYLKLSAFLSYLFGHPE